MTKDFKIEVALTYLTGHVFIKLLIRAGQTTKY